MISVLIVDDEKMIRDDVYGLLSMEDSLELDLSMGTCAEDALKIMEERNVDIIIMDINMPQMSGLELYDIIRERWPYCKIIFLTGYSDFEYVYKVQKHARYVLKAEDDDKLLEALREAIDEIENDLQLKQIQVGMLEELKEDRSYRDRESFIREILDGCIPMTLFNQETIEKLDVRLDLEEPVYYVVMRHDTWLKEKYEEQIQEIRGCLQLVARYFYQNMKGCFLRYNRYYLVLFLQTEKVKNPNLAVKMISDAAELFQKALLLNFNRSMAILVGKKPLMFRRILENFTALRDRTVRMALEEIVVEELKNDSENGGGLTEAVQQELLHMLWKLEYYLEGMDEENIAGILREMQDQLQGVRSMHDLFALELYCSISSKLIGWIKRLNLQEEIAFKIGIMNLYNVSHFISWGEAFAYLIKVTENIFAIKNKSVEQQNEDIIQQVKTYIVEHLAEDTSLYVLAEQVHLSREYLLRIFKKQEGVTILQYINDLKLERARQLLKETDLPIKEIAEQLGFVSQGYFGRFFRGKMGMSPLAYRENKK